MNESAPGLQPLSETEFQQLSDFLDGIENPDALSLEGMDGFFCALIASPRHVMPSEYFPIVWGGELTGANAFASIDDANAILGLMMRHWNAIIAELDRDEVYMPIIEDVEAGDVPGRAWARGFMRGVQQASQESWRELFGSETEGQLLTIPIVAGEVDPDWPREPLTAEKKEDLIVSMAAGFARSYRHFGAARRSNALSQQSRATYRRSTAKVGRNEPCPCGSGRKFKQCCGSADAGTRH